MKKTKKNTGKKLLLTKEKVRDLTKDKIAAVAGGHRDVSASVTATNSFTPG